MHKNRATKILTTACLAVLVVAGALVLGYLLTVRGECVEKTDGGKIEKVCVRNAQFQ